MKVLGYTRVSRDSAMTDSQSLQMQQERIRQYAEYARLEVVDFIVEDGVSAGKPFAKRPGGAEVLRRLEAGEVQGIVALRVDRAFRDLRDAINVWHDFGRREWAIYFVDFGGQPIDPRIPTSRLLFNQMAVLADFERARISERIRENKASRRTNGRTYAVARFGRRNGEGKRIEDAPEEIEILREMQNLRLAGLGYRQIAETLNRRGVPLKQRGKRWHSTTVRKILLREPPPERPLSTEPSGYVSESGESSSPVSS